MRNDNWKAILKNKVRRWLLFQCKAKIKSVNKMFKNNCIFIKSEKDFVAICDDLEVLVDIEIKSMDEIIEWGLQENK